MSYLVHKAVETYFDACMHFNLRDKDVINFKRKGTVVIISTKDKDYIKTINR